MQNIKSISIKRECFFEDYNVFMNSMQEAFKDLVRAYDLLSKAIKQLEKATKCKTEYNQNVDPEHFFETSRKKHEDCVHVWQSAAIKYIRVAETNILTMYDRNIDMILNDWCLVLNGHRVDFDMDRLITKINSELA